MCRQEELDWVVGQFLKKLDDLGIADNTIIVLTSDDGAQKFSWPDGGTEPFRGEKGTTWEGGFRAPCVARWPGVINPRRNLQLIYHRFILGCFAHDPQRVLTAAHRLALCAR
jgi:arylsulfatase A-like enzyme